jgi:LysM repeat protein
LARIAFFPYNKVNLAMIIRAKRSRRTSYMILITRRWQTAVGILMILLLATGCFTNVGDQANEPQISLQITSTEMPTEEPSPTLEPSQEPEETEAIEAQDAVDLPIAENPTETPTATVTATQAITEVAQLGEGLGQLLETEVPNIDPFSLTATSIIATATAGVLMPTWIAETQTAQAIQVNPLATATTDPNLFPVQTATSSGPILSGADCVHEVRTGDTLFRMSMNYGIPVMDIANRNGVTNPDLISVGQMLVINGCGTTGVFPPATSMPTQSFGIGGPSLDNSVQAGSGGCASQYTVNQYDNLFQISLQYGVPVQSIANANGIANINIIDMGSVLCIPAQ